MTEEQTITVAPNWASTRDLAARLMASYERVMAEPCKLCGYKPCRCKEFEAKEREEAKKRMAIEEAKAKKEREIKRLGGVRAYEDFTAEKYTNKALLKALVNFPKESYYLWGKAGTGKTHAAVAVLRKTADGIVKRMSEISREIRTSEAEDEEDIISSYSMGPMLLDDLGSEKATEFLQNMLFEIIDRRWQSKQGGLIITANMSIDKLGGIIGDRTASRIAGLVGAKNTIELGGKDWRIK